MSSFTNYDRILEFIHNNPGSHFRKIKKELGLSVGTIQYQLKKLEDNGKIISLENMMMHLFQVSVMCNHTYSILNQKNMIY